MEIEEGLCQCGCGGKTTFYRKKFKKFVHGHQSVGKRSTLIDHTLTKGQRCYRKNRQKRIDYAKQYSIKNKEKVKENHKKHYLNNIEYYKTKGKERNKRIDHKATYHKKERQEWLKMNKEKMRLYQIEYRKKNKQYLNIVKQSRLNEVKQLVYETFGGRCQNCGDTELANLTIHHVHGRIGEKKHGGHKISGKKLWMMIFMENCPKNKYEMLCWNCHIGSKHNRPKKIKKCPHCGKDI
jgi:hypothetical protein